MYKEIDGKLYYIKHSGEVIDLSDVHMEAKNTINIWRYLGRRKPEGR